MSLVPKVLVHGATIDYEGRASPDPERDSERVQFIPRDTRTPSPVLDPNIGNGNSIGSPTRAKDYARIKKGDVELMQLVNAGYATASLIDKPRKQSLDRALLSPGAELAPSPFRRSDRSAAKTLRQTRSLDFPEQVDTEVIIRDLMSLSKNSPSGASPLHYAQTSKSFSSQVSMVLVETTHTDINVVDKDGDTPLHWAVTHSHRENIELLISLGADPNLCNHKEEAPIHLAINSGNTESARIFFSLKSDNQILFSYRGRNYLHLACEQNDLAMVKLVLACFPSGRPGADILDLPVPLVTLTDHDNMTPIHTAARRCDTQILDLLLRGVSAGEKEITLLSESREGFTPLHYSVDAGRLSNVKLLLTSGASPLTSSRQQQISSVHLAALRWTSRAHNDILTELLMWAKGYDPAVVDIRDSQDRSPLHYAATYDHLQSATLLQSYGANLDSIDRDGNTPLIVAASKGANKVLAFLLSQDADVTAQNHRGQSALLVSIEEGHWKTARELLTCPEEETRSVLVLIPDDSGQSPLHVLCKGAGDYRTAQMLLGLHADVQMHDKNRRIPLHYACHFGSYAMGYRLLQEGEWGTMLNEADHKGLTALHMSARRGHYDLLRLLLQKGAHTTKSLSHDSPFSLACKHGHLKCAQLLYKTNDTMLNWQNSEGHTALHQAATSGHKDTVLWLLDVRSLLLWDNSQRSFADLAIERREQTLMAAVLEHERWREVMVLTSPIAPPPFVSLIKFLPELAKVILERAVTKSTEPHDHVDYFEEVEFSFLTANRGEEQFHRTSSAVSRHHMQRFQSKGKSTQSSMSKTPRPETKRPSLLSRIRSHYSVNNLMRNRFEYERSSLYALHTMIEQYRIGLLTHPVTKRYLDYKWRTYGRIYYTISILPFFLFLFLLTVEVFYSYYITATTFQDTGMVAKSNGSCSSFYQFNRTMLIERGYTEANLATTNFLWNAHITDNATILSSEDNLTCECHPVIALKLFSHKETLIVIPLFLLATAILLFHLFRIVKQPILYWLNAVNIMELGTLLVTLTIREYLSLNLDRAALALFLGYGAMFLSFKRYAWSGLYVTMFLEVITSMIKTILVFLPILFAYVIIFFLMVSPGRGFASIPISLVRIPVMLVGEMDFYDSFLTEANCYRNKEMVYAILIIFIFGITISLANLLIGLAVGDIDNILRQAVVSKSIEQVNWLTEFELGPIYPLFRKWIRWDHLTVFPNRKRQLISKVIAPIDVFGLFSQVYTSQDKLKTDISDPNLLFLVGLKEENNNLKMQLQHATDEISNLQTSVNKLSGVLQKLDQKMDSLLGSQFDPRTLPRSPTQERRISKHNS